MSKYGDFINEARKQESKKPIEQENQKEDLVNLCIKVDRTLRDYWAVEAKKARIPMTRVMIAALEAQFGIPDTKKTSKPE